MANRKRFLTQYLKNTSSNKKIDRGLGKYIYSLLICIRAHPKNRIITKKKKTTMKTNNPVEKGAKQMNRQFPREEHEWPISI